MKQLTCEMCGSTDLLKQDGVFVCQSCGCKYSVEEAKKMMIEGTVDVSGSTVKVDNTDKLHSLLVLATRARKENNTDEAQKYYEMAMLEAPTNWEPAFYSAYYSILNSPISDVSDGLKKFRSRVRTSLELIFSDDFSGNVTETVHDFLSSTAVLYDLIATNDITAFQNVEARAAFLNEQNHNSHAHNDAYFDKRRRSMELLTFICDSILELCNLTALHNYHIDLPILSAMYNTCEKSYWEIARRIVYTIPPHGKDYEGAFIDSVLSYEALRRDENPQYTCKAIGKIIEYDKKFSSMLNLSNDVYLNTVQYIEDKRARYTRARTKRYWDEHPDERRSLEEEKSFLKKQLNELKARIESIPGTDEKAAIQKQIDSFAAEKNGLGLFKVKEKRALQERIDAESVKLKEISDRMEKSKLELEREMNPIQRKIDAIDKKLIEGK